jgi:hypothetical protein
VNDALVPKQFAWSGGFRATQLANIGKLAAHGLDLSVKAFPISRQNVAVDVFANGAYLWQKIVSLGGAAPLKVGGSYVRYRNFLKEGEAPGALFGPRARRTSASIRVTCRTTSTVTGSPTPKRRPSRS